MKIGIVYPVFEWSSRFIAQSISKSFNKLGYEVVEFDPVINKKIYSFLINNKNNDISINYRYIYDLIFERITFRILEEKPEFVLYVHGGYISKRFIDIVKKYNITTGLWLLDDPHEIDYSKQYSAFYDFVFTVEKNAVDVHKKRNQNVFYLPLGYDEDFFYPKEVGDEYKSEICIVGSGFKERIELLEKIYPYIKNRNIKLVGLWGGLNKQSPLLKHVIEGVVGPDIASSYYSGAKIVLNQHREKNGSYISTNIFGIEGSSPNPRLFESIACNTLCIIDDKRKGCFDFFENKKEIDSYVDEKELVEKINFWLDNEEIRKEVAKRALIKNKQNTMTQRIKLIEEICIKQSICLR